MIVSKWIQFSLFQRGEKTNNYMVAPKEGGMDAPVLGYVKWYGPWRCYAFFPNPESVFERQCLRDIAAFCEERTKAHMAQAKRRTS